jgi:hypothetical protein
MMRLAYCQKSVDILLTKNARMKVANPVDRRMRARIRARQGGWVFSAMDFLDLGSRQAVDQALSRMAATGKIRRVSRGLYDVPRVHPIVGVAGPDIDKFARAIGAKLGVRLQPTGAYAANLLGLSDQVPAKVVYLTDGRTRRARLDQLDIVFRQTSPRNMATAGRISGLVIQALRYLGRAQVSDATIARLRRRLAVDHKAQLLKDVGYAPAWIGNIIRRLAPKA